MGRKSRLKAARSDPQSSSSSSSSMRGKVLALECTNETAAAEDRKYGRVLRTGDIVQELRIGDSKIQDPFKKGKSGVQKFLHDAFIKNQDTTVAVRVRHGKMPNQVNVVHTCLVPMDDLDSDCSAERKIQYMLSPSTRRNYGWRFRERTLAECYQLQASRRSRTGSPGASSNDQPQPPPPPPPQPRSRGGSDIVYPWETKMEPLPSYAAFFSMLFLPKSNSTATQFLFLDDTTAIANFWLTASRKSGVPIHLLNVQTESLIAEISVDSATSNFSTVMLTDIPNLAKASSYAILDCKGLGVGLIRAVRLWYLSDAGELRFNVAVKEEDTELGFGLNRSDEGFIYISSTAKGNEDVPFVRSGLCGIYKDAVKASKLLVISRIEDQKVLPWMFSSTGAIHAFEIESILHSMCVHFKDKLPISIDVFMWDRVCTAEPPTSSVPAAGARATSSHDGREPPRSSGDVGVCEPPTSSSVPAAGARATGSDGGHEPPRSSSNVGVCEPSTSSSVPAAGARATGGDDGRESPRSSGNVGVCEPSTSSSVPAAGARATGSDDGRESRRSSGDVGVCEPSTSSSVPAAGARATGSDGGHEPPRSSSNVDGSEPSTSYAISPPGRHRHRGFRNRH